MAALGSWLLGLVAVALLGSMGRGGRYAGAGRIGAGSLSMAGVGSIPIGLGNLVRTEAPIQSSLLPPPPLDKMAPGKMASWGRCQIREGGQDGRFELWAKDGANSTIPSIKKIGAKMACSDGGQLQGGQMESPVPEKKR